MAKKKPEKPRMPATADPEIESEVRHIQIKIPANAYERGKRIAKANGLSMNAYVRQAVLQRIRSDAGELQSER